MAQKTKSPGDIRRKYPRRAFHRRIGILRHGSYFLAESQEIGEGGAALVLPESFAEGDELVVTLRIPGGDFVSLRAQVRSVRTTEAGIVHGVSFPSISFSHKRQIRSYVSARSESESVLV